jgi:N-methylhydantoinase A
MNAYIAPMVEHYLTNLQGSMHDLGVPAGLHVMQSNGGVMTAAAAREHPIQTLMSGPVGGTIGGAGLSDGTGRPNLLCVDMGGTSFDMSLIVNGRPNVSTETELEGLPVLMPLVDIHTIGAGGGSLAWLEAGALRVGPQSAGAVPGPVCYGRGGTEPTVTDANLFLGRLDPDFFLGGRMTLDEKGTADAIHRMAGALGMDDVTFAEGVLSIINAKMADAMRTITVKQGIDPRDYSLVAFGGAGPMHAVFLANELNIHETIIPWSPGTFSAWGMLQTDIRHDVTQTFYQPVSGITREAVQDVYRHLEEQGQAVLLTEGVSPDDMYYLRSADMRYIGQEYWVNVSVGEDVNLEAIENTFHEAHRVRYGHSTPGAPVEFVNLRVAALGRLKRGVVGFQAPQAGEDPVTGTRQVVFEGRPHDTTILLRRPLAPGAQYRGPLVVEEDTATSVIPPGYAMRVDDLGNLIVTPE